MQIITKNLAIIILLLAFLPFLALADNSPTPEDAFYDGRDLSITEKVAKQLSSP